MKKSFFLHLPIFVLILVIFSCSDKVVREPTYASPSISPALPVLSPADQKILWVDAGIDQVIFLPITGTFFTPNAIDFFKQQTNLKYEWKKTKGPDMYKIDDSTKIRPFLSNLETGIYEFVFTATTPDGRFDTDTVNIQVAQPMGEFVIPNLLWECPVGGCGLQIQVKIPKDKPVRIYIKPEGSVSDWVEVIILSPTAAPPNPPIFYGIENESLWIGSYDEQIGKCDVKIVF